MITLIVLCAVCVLLFIKNEVNFKIQRKWIDEIYNDRVGDEGVLHWDMKPSYMQTLFDPFLWKHKPLKEYLKIS